ncbi:MAG: YggS family pyridoxal phosphate-dependent enzyme [Oscillospiraceae bacterium]|nr:YggS family pyridoxal phosphate-dependent enzyme [Oscillospiraceae bacterium]
MEVIAQRVAMARALIAESALNAGRKPEEICLLAATKTQPPENIRQAIDAGVDAVGENRVQEMLDKQASYKGAPVHFIGRLQRNKVKFLIGKVSLIHSIDSIPLLETVNRLAGEQNICQEVLLQVNIGDEDTKGGFSLSGIEKAAEIAVNMPNINPRGLMCIPPFSEPEKYFENMLKKYVDIKTKVWDNGAAGILSMGMSHDFHLAIAYGSTMVRLGSNLFGSRAVT